MSPRRPTLGDETAAVRRTVGFPTKAAGLLEHAKTISAVAGGWVRVPRTGLRGLSRYRSEPAI